LFDEKSFSFITQWFEKLSYTQTPEKSFEPLREGVSLNEYWRFMRYIR
jgi:hypothetical protein